MVARGGEVITSVATSWTVGAWTGVNSANPVFATLQAVVVVVMVIVMLGVMVIVMLVEEMNLCTEH